MGGCVTKLGKIQAGTFYGHPTSIKSTHEDNCSWRKWWKYVTYYSGLPRSFDLFPKVIGFINVQLLLPRKRWEDILIQSDIIDWKTPAAELFRISWYNKPCKVPLFSCRMCIYLFKSIFLPNASKLHQKHTIYMQGIIINGFEIRRKTILQMQEKQHGSWGGPENMT